MRLALLLALVCACSGSEALRYTLPVKVDSSFIVPVDNDLGWKVTLEEVRLVASGLELTTAGEAHAHGHGPMDTFLALFVGRARAHPGHLADGDVSGELAGPFLIDWAAPGLLGEAVLYAADYEGANLRLVEATSDHGLKDDDPLVGSAAYLAGTATLGARVIRFEASLTLPDPAVIVGLPFTLEGDNVAAGRTTLGLAILPEDPVEGDTLFDGLDFGALADQSALASDNTLTLSGDSLNRLRRAFFTHDHFTITTETP